MFSTQLSNTYTISIYLVYNIHIKTTYPKGGFTIFLGKMELNGKYLIFEHENLLVMYQYQLFGSILYILNENYTCIFIIICFYFYKAGIYKVCLRLLAMEYVLWLERLRKTNVIYGLSTFNAVF